MNRKNLSSKIEKPLKYVSRLFSRINHFLERISALLHILLILLIFFICSQAISFCIVYIQLLTEKPVSLWLFRYINIWHILVTDSITREIIVFNSAIITEKIIFMVNIFIALSSILLSAFTFISYFRKTISIRRKSCFRKKEIFLPGVDDIKIMIDYFINADYVAVFSHSFSWLNKNEDIRNILTELADKRKLKLMTSNDLNEVRQTLTQCSDKLKQCMSAGMQSNQGPLRFSYIERDNAKYLLYRQEEDEHTYVIIVRENIESQYLLHTISQLVKS